MEVRIKFDGDGAARVEIHLPAERTNDLFAAAAEFIEEKAHPDLTVDVCYNEEILAIRDRREGQEILLGRFDDQPGAGFYGLLIREDRRFAELDYSQPSRGVRFAERLTLDATIRKIPALA